MSDSTPNLALSYILAAQAQKHVTHNEAIRALDALVQLSVLDRDLTAPPGSPADGARYIVAGSATGAWSGHAGKVAAFQDGAWAFYAPNEGWQAWVADEDVAVTWTGSAWAPASAQNVPMLGVNTTADATNRLAIKSAASLFDNAGNGHQHKINKAAASDTASLLFQTNYSGRAEMGTAGDDHFRFKVSSDGTTWKTAFKIDPSTGAVGVAMVGALAPVASLHLVGSISDASIGVTGLRFDRYDPSGASAAAFIFRKATISTSVASPSAVLNGDDIGALIYRGHGSSGFLAGGCTIVGRAAEDHSTTAAGQNLLLSTNPLGSVGSVERLRIEADGTTRPGADNTYTMGSSAFRWASIWAANGTIQTSDAREKAVAARLDGTRAAGIVDTIDPVMFRWKVGGHEMVPHPTETETDVEGNVAPKMAPRPVPGKRLHAGFLAQEVKAAMDAAGVDFGVWGLENAADPESRQWLRPDQMIPLLWAALQETRAQLAAVKSHVTALAHRAGEAEVSD